MESTVVVSAELIVVGIVKVTVALLMEEVVDATEAVEDCAYTLALASLGREATSADIVVTEAAEDVVVAAIVNNQSQQTLNAKRLFLFERSLFF